MLSAAIYEHTRSQCAAAAMTHAEWPVVNLLGLDNSEAEARRRRCHQAALLRFLMPTETVPEVQYNKTHKRKTSTDMELINRTLVATPMWICTCTKAP